MSYEYSEDQLIENATQKGLEALGWEVLTAWKNESFGINGLLGRENKSEVILKRHLRAALKKFNPDIPEIAFNSAIDKIIEKSAAKTLAQTNKEKYALLKNGVDVTFKDENGISQSKRLKIFDFDIPENNHFLAVRQLEVVGDLYNRRPDVIGFVNGIPLVFIELKSHCNDLEHAYADNIKDYKDTIPHVFHHNAFIILSNGTDARVGTVTSKYQFFLEWKRIEEDDEGIVALDTMLKGVCDKNRLLDIFENFLLFDDGGGEPSKIMAKNHQYIGVNKVISQSGDFKDLQTKLGVFWHTQGSGKSYSMVFLCEKILRRFGGGFTFVIVVDRSELENQIYDTFTSVGVTTSKGVVATSREDLRRLLSEDHRYIFTIIHKFSIDPKTESEFPLLSERKNIIVISDEAHRTQGGVFAQNLRFKALPNASFIGFTGTPLIKEELEVTRNIFGEYVSIYDFKRAIEDKATLPLRYINRGEKLEIDRPELDETMAEIIENEDLNQDQIAKLQGEFARDYPILTSPVRLEAIAKDLVWHFNERGYQGKAMFVAIDKPTAVKMYDLVQKFWPVYIDELKSKIAKADDVQELAQLKLKLKQVEETEICVVVSSEQGEVEKFKELNLDIETHRKKMVQRDLEKEFKDPENNFRLAIVCAMWITGFDAPCVSTVYLDKPIKGHTLMQTIARANRVYDDEKENGLIVDYGNVYKKLEEAYSVYGDADDRKGGGNGGKPDDEDAQIKLEGLEVELAASIGAVAGMLGGVGFELGGLIECEDPMVKLAMIKKATNCVCLNETTRTQFEFLARDVFRKFKALYPDELVKKHVKAQNAIDAIYSQLNQKKKAANIWSVIMKLQAEVDKSISIVDDEKLETYVDLSKLDFDKLKKIFAKSENKNVITFDVQEAIEKRLEQMVQVNPVRLEFYEKYKKIIEEYNNGKDAQAVQKTFEALMDFVRELGEEEARAMREGLDEETLAIFDILRKPDLSKKDEEEVKKVAKETLEDLKREKLRVKQWRESLEVSASVKVMISDHLQYLPVEVYDDYELLIKSNLVYQHVYANYGNLAASHY